MTSPELEDLLSRYFEGELDAAGESRLDEILGADPEAFDRFKGLVGVEGLLRARSAADDARAALPERVAETLRFEERRRRLTDRVMKSVAERRVRASRPSRPSWAWGFAGIAAAAFLAVVAAVASRPGPAPIAEPDGAARIEERRPAAAPLPEEERIPEPRKPEAPAPVREIPPPDPAPRPSPPEAPKPAPAEEKRSDPPAESPAAPPAPRTVVAVAELSGVGGTVFLLEGGERRRAESRPLLAGQGIETGADGTAVLQWADGTRAELGPATEVREVQDRDPAAPGRKARGRRVQLARGTVAAVVSRQPADQPMSIVTPHGEARVLGTALRLSVRPDGKGSTQLEVTEGRVRFTRSRDGKSADVAAGQALVVPGDAEWIPVRAVVPDEIVLSARQARLVGEEWKVVADRRAAGGALEAQGTAAGVADHVSKRPSYAEFTFWASAEREYRVWIRGASQPTGDPWTRDFLTVASAGAEFNQKCRFFGTSGETAFLVAGFSKFSGFGWIGGFVENPAVEGPPLTIRFAKPGLQTLRLYVAHPSIRVDSVWLSATQVSRPGAKQLPPVLDR